MLYTSGSDSPLAMNSDHAIGVTHFIVAVAQQFNEHEHMLLIGVRRVCSDVF